MMNFSITINGEGAELTNALHTLRKVLGENVSGEGAVTATIQPSAPVPPAPQPEQSYAYQGQVSTTYPQPSVPVSPPPTQSSAVPTAVPTTAPSYSIDQLGVAAGPLVDAGRGAELTAWLNQHGAAALTQLDRSYYGEFATFLRSLGARI